MKNQITARILFPSQVAVLALASAIAIPAMAQQTQQPDKFPECSGGRTADTDLDSSGGSGNTAPRKQKEGFWGRVNPMARKKWVKKRLDPINDRLTELDQVNAKNSSDIKDVDSRATAGIKKAQDPRIKRTKWRQPAGDAGQEGERHRNNGFRSR